MKGPGRGDGGDGFDRDHVPNRVHRLLTYTSSTGCTMTTSPLPNLVARTTVSAEYAALMGNGHCPTGMYVLPTADSMFVWDVVLFVHQGRLMWT